MSSFETSICVPRQLTHRTKIQRHANRAGLLGLALLLLVALLAFSGCATHKKHGPPAPEAEPIGQVLPPGDTEFTRSDSDNPAENGPSRGVVVQPHRTLLDKLTGRTPAPRYYPPGTSINAGKKSTINNYNGPATVSTTTVGKKGTAATAEGATATAIGKAKGPTAIGDSATAQDFTKQGQRGGAAASGAGATATATTIKPPTPWLKYGLWALGGLATYWVLFGGGGAVLLALWRRNKSNPNQA